MPKYFRTEFTKNQKFYHNKYFQSKMEMRALCSKTHFHAFSNPIFKNKKNTQKYCV